MRPVLHNTAAAGGRLDADTISFNAAAFSVFVASVMDWLVIMFSF